MDRAWLRVRDSRSTVQNEWYFAAWFGPKFKGMEQWSVGIYCSQNRFLPVFFVYFSNGIRGIAWLNFLTMTHVFPNFQGLIYVSGKSGSGKSSCFGLNQRCFLWWIKSSQDRMSLPAHRYVLECFFYGRIQDCNTSVDPLNFLGFKNLGRFSAFQWCPGLLSVITRDATPETGQVLLPPHLRVVHVSSVPSFVKSMGPWLGWQDR